MRHYHRAPRRRSGEAGLAYTEDIAQASLLLAQALRKIDAAEWMR